MGGGRVGAQVTTFLGLLNPCKAANILNNFYWFRSASGGRATGRNAASPHTGCGSAPKGQPPNGAASTGNGQLQFALPQLQA